MLATACRIFRFLQMNSILKARLGVMYESMALKGADFLEDAAKAEGAVKTNRCNVFCWLLQSWP